MELLTVSDGVDTATISAGLNAWTIEINVSNKETERQKRILEAGARAVELEGGGYVNYWIEKVNEESDLIPTSAGYQPHRDLWRLHRPLPAPETDFITRPFKEEDALQFLTVNNRSFDWHPEQGNMTLEDLRRRQSESWYSSEGFRIWETEKEIGGFCWTKIHQEDKEKTGEIYAIAVDPSHRSSGIGIKLALSGMTWLSNQGIREIFLYVESDNIKAKNLYNKLGFQLQWINRCYQRTIRSSKI